MTKNGYFPTKEEVADALAVVKEGLPEGVSRDHADLMKALHKDNRDLQSLCRTLIELTLQIEEFEPALLTAFLLGMETALQARAQHDEQSAIVA